MLILMVRKRHISLRSYTVEFKPTLKGKNKQYAKQANKGCLKVVFQPRDWVWVHMRNERFPTQRKSKLQPRGDRPFQVLERINANAYKRDLQSKYGNVSACFNVVDLSLFDVGDSRTNPFEEGGKNRDRGVDQVDHVDETKYSQDPSHWIGGPMTRARTKIMKDALQGLILQVQDKETALEDSMTKFEGSIASQSMVNISCCGRGRFGRPK